MPEDQARGICRWCDRAMEYSSTIDMWISMGEARGACDARPLGSVTDPLADKSWARHEPRTGDVPSDPHDLAEVEAWLDA